jgi:phospholipid-translocating ATPase
MLTHLAEEDIELNGVAEQEQENGREEASSLLRPEEEEGRMREKNQLQQWWGQWKALFEHKYRERFIYASPLQQPIVTPKKMPTNKIKNTKYNPFTFIFVVLFEQFKFFFNFYFLIVALTQFIPPLKVGFTFTYVLPLVFVLAVTISKEAYDDIKRYLRDREQNAASYLRMNWENGQLEAIPSARIQVGDIIQVRTNMRVPADMVLLRTTEKSGASFIRTDQLDGETDWKLRHAVSCTQELETDEALVNAWTAEVFVEKPRKAIYEFIGRVRIGTDTTNDEPLSAENTVWANTVVASGTIFGLVVFTGMETRAVMNANAPVTKVGLLDMEINTLSKVMCVILVGMATIMVMFRTPSVLIWLYWFRFILLFSAIIPISMRVNLDMGKTVYSLMIMRDSKIAGTVVRTSTIPEELGRISYVFSDKTGTLTKNEMIFKKLHLGSVLYSEESLSDMQNLLQLSYAHSHTGPASFNTDPNDQVEEDSKLAAYRLREIMQAIAICHNVTPVKETDEAGEVTTTYQAASPDEVALCEFAESVGLTLSARELSHMTLKNPLGGMEEFDVLNVFPFSSERKRMGIIVRNCETGEIFFFMKGADVIMMNIVQASDWLEEECDTMAREGLRTLVFGRKRLSQPMYDAWAEKYAAAKATIENRNENVDAVLDNLEVDLELLCLSGVEDKLQDDVKQSLEMLRHAGVSVWMLTGDKVETAICIGTSSRLISRDQAVFKFLPRSKIEAAASLNEYSKKPDAALVIDGTALQICLDHLNVEFFEMAKHASCVICCRCSPQQKADVVTAMKILTKKRTLAIGDGGNDVSMILSANVGVGIVGKEGKQASLAADFSINQFSFLTRLMIWHGRNSYKRSARLSQFVIHRGIIISIIQAVFSAIFYFSAIAVYQGWLIVGYATYYTMFPVFSLVLDKDVKEEIAFRYPELYRDLQKGRSLSLKTFMIWLWKSVYQGGLIMILSILLFENNFLNIVAITFTCLIFAELINVAFEIHIWHRYMVFSLAFSVIAYVLSLFILRDYFDIRFILSLDFVIKTFIITCASTLPLLVAKLIDRKCRPPAYMKVK